MRTLAHPGKAAAAGQAIEILGEGLSWLDIIPAVLCADPRQQGKGEERGHGQSPNQFFHGSRWGGASAI